MRASKRKSRRVTAYQVMLFFILATLVVVVAHPKALATEDVSQEEPLSISRRPHFEKVIVIVFENKSRNKVYKQPTFALAAKNGARLLGMLGETHPSQGNYLALIGGSTFGVTYDNNIDLNESHLGDLLEAKGRDWHVYAEDYPGNCYTGQRANDYARRHNPFISFLSVSLDRKRCAKITDEENFLRDLEQNRLADYSLYVPNLKNDGHDTSLNYAGKWLYSKLGPYIENPSRLGDTLLILTFDESEFFLGNQIYTVLLGGQVAPNASSGQRVNHVSLLRMIEEEWGLGTLNREDRTSPRIEGIWQ